MQRPLCTDVIHKIRWIVAYHSEAKSFYVDGSKQEVYTAVAVNMFCVIFQKINAPLFPLPPFYISRVKVTD